ncbi:MAG: hypothetical protein AB7K36_05395 [Chloroflexota bacterium]
MSHDIVAYPLHALCGHLLNRLEMPPAAAGLEWLKAAAHARSGRALNRVVRGLSAVRQREGSDDLALRLGIAIVDQVTCHGDDVRMRRRQLTALARAGIQLPLPDRLPHNLLMLANCRQCLQGMPVAMDMIEPDAPDHSAKGEVGNDRQVI